MNQCDHGHECHEETRLLPTGGDGNMIVCRRHYHHELTYREQQNRRYGEGKWKLPTWNSLKVYADRNGVVQ
jgi:hypothetical protein